MVEPRRPPSVTRGGTTTEITAKTELAIRTAEAAHTVRRVRAGRPFRIRTDALLLTGRSRRVFFCRRHEEGIGAADARRVHAAVAAQEPRLGAQMVQRLDVAGQTVQAARLPRGTQLEKLPVTSVKKRPPSKSRLRRDARCTIKRRTDAHNDDGITPCFDKRLLRTVWTRVHFVRKIFQLPLPYCFFSMNSSL